MVTQNRMHLEHQSSALRLLVTTAKIVSIKTDLKSARITYPSSKCLQRFSDSCSLVLHLTHSNRNTTFLVVLAFLWKTGLV